MSNNAILNALTEEEQLDLELHLLNTYNITGDVYTGKVTSYRPTFSSLKRQRKVQFMI